jgi:acetyl-CoA acetyltransferase
MPSTPLSALVGLGFSELSRLDIGTARDLAIDAVNAAVADSGLGLDDVDGLLLGHSPSAPFADLPLRLQNDLGLFELRLLASIEGEGTTAVQMVQHATMAIRHGLAKNVVCVFADAPLKPGAESGSVSFRRTMSLTGIDDWESRYALVGAAGAHALATRRYLSACGASEADLGAYAVSNRRWAERNPDAALRKPLTVEDYLASRYIVEPLRLLDCAYPVNGAVAVVVTGCELAAEGPRPPVWVHGMGQGHYGRPGLAAFDRELRTGGELAGKTAYAMAGVRAADVRMCQLYDAFSYLGLLALEDYGLCPRGEAPAFVQSGACAPGGSLPTNTGGGHLSGFYLQGMTPLSEAIIQARGDGGARQVERRDVILVNGVGGCADYHAALVLSPLRSLA